jgi:hypothetical protein
MTLPACKTKLQLEKRSHVDRTGRLPPARSSATKGSGQTHSCANDPVGAHRRIALDSVSRLGDRRLSSVPAAQRPPLTASGQERELRASNTRADLVFRSAAVSGHFGMSDNIKISLCLSSFEDGPPFVDFDSLMSAQCLRRQSFACWDFFPQSSNSHPSNWIG